MKKLAAGLSSVLYLLSGFKVLAADAGPSPAGLTQLEGVFSAVISSVVGLAFITLLILLVWSGFKFLMSGGEPKAIASARDTMTWAMLGVVFLVLAWIILQLIHSFTGIDVTVFDLRTLCGTGGTQFCSPKP